MVMGIERLRAAGDLLREGDNSPATLQQGVLGVWTTMLDQTSWPLELSEKSLELRAMMFRYGPVCATIEQIGAAGRVRLCRELLGFIEFAERLNGQGDAVGRETGWV